MTDEEIDLYIESAQARFARDEIWELDLERNLEQILAWKDEPEYGTVQLDKRDREMLRAVIDGSHPSCRKPS